MSFGNRYSVASQQSNPVDRWQIVPPKKSHVDSKQTKKISAQPNRLFGKSPSTKQTKDALPQHRYFGEAPNKFDRVSDKKTSTEKVGLIPSPPKNNNPRKASQDSYVDTKISTQQESIMPLTLHEPPPTSHPVPEIKTPDLSTQAAIRGFCATPNVSENRSHLEEERYGTPPRLFKPTETITPERFKKEGDYVKATPFRYDFPLTQTDFSHAEKPYTPDENPVRRSKDDSVIIDKKPDDGLRKSCSAEDLHSWRLVEKKSSKNKHMSPSDIDQHRNVQVQNSHYAKQTSRAQHQQPKTPFTLRNQYGNAFNSLFRDTTKHSIPPSPEQGSITTGKKSARSRLIALPIPHTDISINVSPTAKIFPCSHNMTGDSFHLISALYLDPKAHILLIRPTDSESDLAKFNRIYNEIRFFHDEERVSIIENPDPHSLYSKLVKTVTPKFYRAGYATSLIQDDAATTRNLQSSFAERLNPLLHTYYSELDTLEKAFGIDDRPKTILFSRSKNMIHPESNITADFLKTVYDLFPKDGSKQFLLVGDRLNTPLDLPGMAYLNNQENVLNLLEFWKTPPFNTAKESTGIPDTVLQLLVFYKLCQDDLDLNFITPRTGGVDKFIFTLPSNKASFSLLAPESFNFERAEKLESANCGIVPLRSPASPHGRFIQKINQFLSDHSVSIPESAFQKIKAVCGMNFDSNWIIQTISQNLSPHFRKRNREILNTFLSHLRDLSQPFETHKYLFRSAESETITGLIDTTRLEEPFKHLLTRKITAESAEWIKQGILFPSSVESS